MEPNEQPLTPTLREAGRRRADLHHALVDLEHALASAAGGRSEDWRLEVAKRLAGLRDAVAEHIEVTERPGGLYEEILMRAPRLANQLGRLHEEHPEMLAHAIDILERLEATPPGEPLRVAEIREEVHRLLGKVVRHRETGADLVWEAYNVDIGGLE